LSVAIESLIKNYKFTLVYKPFILDPNIPPGGQAWRDHLVLKFGEKVAKQEMKGQGPISKAGKSIVSNFCVIVL
jgi:Predicted dithiol-disulfide isomerase involved in polyketide biosynthesis